MALPNEVNYSDLEDIRMLKEEMNLKHQELAVAINELVEVNILLLKAKAKLEIIKDAKKDVEEEIRIKKLELNLQPRG